MWKSTGGHIVREQSGEYYYTPETEGSHTITLLVADKVAGLIVEANININVSDGLKKTSANAWPDWPKYFVIGNYPFFPGTESNRWTNDFYLFINSSPLWHSDNYFNADNYQNIADYLSPFNQNMGYEKASLKNYFNYLPIDPFTCQDGLFASESYTASINHYFDISHFNNIYNNLYQFEPSWDYPEWFNNNYPDFIVSQ